MQDAIEQSSRSVGVARGLIGQNLTSKQVQHDFLLVKAKGDRRRENSVQIRKLGSGIFLNLLPPGERRGDEIDQSQDEKNVIDKPDVLLVAQANSMCDAVIKKSVVQLGLLTIPLLAAILHNRTGSKLPQSIAANAVRRHGGRIGARNADDGGLIVRISLPYITDNKQV